MERKNIMAVEIDKKTNKYDKSACNKLDDDRLFYGALGRGFLLAATGGVSSSASTSNESVQKNSGSIAAIGILIGGVLHYLAEDKDREFKNNCMPPENS